MVIISTMYREADKTYGWKYNMRQKQKIQYGAEEENTIWGKRRNCKRRQKLEKSSGPYNESPHAGGRTTSCGPLVLSASASACIFCFCPILYCISGTTGAHKPIVCFSFPASYKIGLGMASLCQLRLQLFYLTRLGESQGVDGVSSQKHV